MIYSKFLIFSFFCVIFCFSLKASEKIDPIEKPLTLSINQQDMPRLKDENPLDGLSKFTFLAMCPSPSKSLSDKINLLIEKELSKYGSIKKIDPFVKTEKGEVFNLDNPASGIFLLYQIENLSSSDGKNSGIVRTSLNLSTPVTIEKTDKLVSSYIWSDNYFLNGSIDKNVDSLVSQSLSHLIQKFMENYSAANSQKPIFYVYAP